MGDEFDDVIIFLDEEGNKKDMHVKIVEVGPAFVTFRNMSNNLISIPAVRVFKIKRRGDEGPI